MGQLNQSHMEAFGKDTQYEHLGERVIIVRGFLKKLICKGQLKDEHMGQYVVFSGKYPKFQEVIPGEVYRNREAFEEIYRKYGGDFSITELKHSFKLVVDWDLE